MVHGAWCVVHGAWCVVHAQSACRASEASRVMRHPLFQRGPRGLLVHKCGQAAEHAQPVRAFSRAEREFCAWREGKGTRLPSAGRQPTRQTVRARHEFVPREFWRAPQTKRVREGSFFRQALSLSQQRKCGKTAIANGLPLQVAIRGTRLFSTPAVGRSSSPARLRFRAEVKSSQGVVPERATRAAGYGPLSIPDVGHLSSPARLRLRAEARW